MTRCLRWALWVAAGASPIVLLACGRSTPTRDAGIATGLGGSTAGTAPADAPATGGAPGTGGLATAGAQAGGGDSGTGGQHGEAGASGGRSGPGGQSRSGGSADASGTGGRSGGQTAGSGGLAGPGGSSAGGHTSGSGGTLSDGGGATGVDGGSGAVAFPPKFFGNIDTSGSIRSDFAGMWDQFTPETAGKWGSVQATSSTFNWTTLDAMYQYCEENHIVFKERNFIWGDSEPAWITSTTARTAAPAWMKAFCDRYPNTRIIDVVYEPIHMTPPFIDGLGGRGTSGYDWVAQSFKWAREACPNAVLTVTDYNIVEYQGDHDKFLQMMKAMKELEAPIMAIGAQGHDAYKLSGSTVAASIADLVRQTGLPVYIAELDVGVADDTQQAAIMKDLVTTFWNDPNVRGVTYWGYVVGKTWRSNTGLMQSDGTRRPALIWLMDFLHRP